MKSNHTKTAIITGASSGIGKATATELAKLGFDLFLTARRQERLAIMKTYLENEFGITVNIAVFDIRERDEVRRFVEETVADRSIDVLVNNAGLAAGLGPLHEGNIDDWERMIDTNVKGLLYITRMTAPRMILQQHGHIVNIGSVAGIEVYPNGNVYCATKHAVKALSDALRVELFDKGIRVTNIAPGLVETEFSLVRFEGDRGKASSVYSGLEPLRPEDIAECIAFAVSRPRHVTIADMLILSSDQGTATSVNRKA